MRKQHGISLIVVLIGLLIISFAAAALLRSSDTSTLVAGNVTIKKTALQSGDAVSEAAIAWLTANSAGTALHNDDDAAGYYATSRDTCDLTGSRTPDQADDDVDWTNAGLTVNCNVAGVLLNPAPAGVEPGYTVRYIINRMCNAEGNPNSALSASGGPMICSRADVSTAGSSTQVGPTFGRFGFTGTTQTYYRITARISGPRDTVRYVQAFVVQ
jgi:type IV pilus assembly protein PilX